MSDLDPIYEQLAKSFHDNYERLAPDFGYKTREASAVPWEDVPEANRDLMAATVKAVLAIPDDAYWFTVDSLAAALITLPAIAPGYVTDEEERMKAGRVIADAIIQAAKEAERE